jgi:DNA-directed RNA polymerase specialized sigma24 family protein
MPSNLSQILKKTARKMGKTEQEILDEIDRICLLVANQIHFAYYDIEDIRQEGLILGLEVLSQYDFKRPLPNLLYTHIRNRILNIKRRVVTRTDPPCTSCHQSVDGHSEHDDGRYCTKYKNWYNINFGKRSIAQPMELEEKPLAGDDIVGDSVEVKDLLEQIDKTLPVEMRETYLRMRAGEEVEQSLQDQVENFIKELLYAE